MKYEKLSKKAIGCMYIASLICTSIVVVIVTLLLYFIIPKDLWIARYIAFGLIGLLLLNFIIGPSIRYNRYRYLINEEYIDVKKGFIYIERQIVPIERLHNIEISKGPINRLFGMAEVKVTTAASTVSIQFLEDKQAEFIVESLQKRINVVAFEKKMRNLDKIDETKNVSFVKSQEDTLEVIQLDKQMEIKDIKED